MAFRPPPPINTSAEAPHPTSLRRSEVLAIQNQLDEFDYDAAPLDQFYAIRLLLQSLAAAGLTQEHDVTEILTSQATLESIIAKIGRGESVRHDSKPYEFLNVIQKIIERILPYAADGGRRKRKTRRTSRKNTRKWKRSK